MSTLLKNKAIITYDNKIIESPEVITAIGGYKLVVHKRSLTSNVDIIDENPISEFNKDETIPIEIQLINYESQPATGIVIRIDLNGNEVKAVKIMDSIPNGLQFINDSVILFQYGKVYKLNKINDIYSYNNGDYSYIISHNTITIFIPNVAARSDALLTFHVKNDGTILPGEIINNQASVDYNENPNIDIQRTHIPQTSELISMRNSASDIIIIKEAPKEVRTNEIFSYSIIVKNQGEAVESNLSIVDHLPNNFNIINGGLTVKKGYSMLMPGINYIAAVNNGILTINGIANNQLDLNAGETLTVTISGYVSL